ncbi:response regulator [Neptunicella marina]|uniref:Response regulator n=1 Tax=Neptunicella marina TaxID=2125989 RepID=A0A8J6IXS7_9ALTE|nr:response regulator [Neptunicella marina]MBC3767208.1 response regulator [Neptunicella marina]
MNTVEPGKNILLFSMEENAEQALLEAMTPYKKRLLVIDSYKDICLYLSHPEPNVVLISAKSFQQCLAIYYQALDMVKDSDLCDHAFVPLIAREEQREAFKAFANGIIDDFIVSRPLTEVHRPIMVCNHVLKELGIGQSRKAKASYVEQQEHFSDKMKEIVLKGVKRKDTLREQFNHCIVEIDQALDHAALKIQQHQKVKLDLERLKKTLSAIRSDDIRPALLKLQDKAIQLLQGLMDDVEQASSEPAIPKANNAEAAAQSEQKQSSTAPKDPEFNQLYGKEVNADKVIEQMRNLPQILLVEDDPISLNLTLQLLSHYRLNIDSAANGRRAFANLSSKKYDLVIMDTHLPDTDGIYIIDQLKSQQGPNQQTPVAILTNMQSKASMQKAKEVGGAAYLLKPLDKLLLTSLFDKLKLPLGG